MRTDPVRYIICHSKKFYSFWDIRKEKNKYENAWVDINQFLIIITELIWKLAKFYLLIVIT